MTMPAGDYEQIMSDTDAAQHESESTPPAVQPDQAQETAPDIRDTLPDAISVREARRLAGIVHRIDVLTAAIERSPDAPVNYVLRGEMLLDGGDFDLAADDFQ